MSLEVDYPSEGIYASGRPRLVQRDAAGTITLARLATTEEARDFGMIFAMHTLAEALNNARAEVQAVQTYGLRIEK